MQSEEDSAAAAREGFEREALPHRAALVALAFQLTKDTDDAQDLVQDTYCKALRYWGTYSRGTNCRAWLFRICRNEFVRGWRRRRCRPERVVPPREGEGTWAEANVLSASVPPVDPSDRLSYRWLAGVVEAALVRIPHLYRSPLMLRLDGVPYKDIATALGVPDGTVKSRIHRGRKLLRESVAGSL